MIFVMRERAEMDEFPTNDSESRSQMIALRERATIQEHQQAQQARQNRLLRTNEKSGPIQNTRNEVQERVKDNDSNETYERVKRR